MLGHRLARHIEPRAELAQGLAVLLKQPIEQFAAVLVRQGPKGRIKIHGLNMQPFGCLSRRERLRRIAMELAVETEGRVVYRTPGVLPCATSMIKRVAR